MPKTDLFTRLITSVVFVIILLAAILFNEYLFLVIFSVINILTLFEIFKIIEKTGNKTQKYFGLISGFFIFLISFLTASGLTPPISFLLISLIVTAVFIHEIYTGNENKFIAPPLTLFGIIYVTIPLSAINFIAFPGINNGEFTYKYLLALFIILWANDTGAYLIGKKIGKNKLFERISPKKTWEGTIGGALTALITVYPIALSFPELNLPEWIIFAVITIIFGTYGDLFESLIKRKANIKDSGNIMPGHGGLLDRFDSTLFAAPVIFLYLKIIEIFF